MLRSKRLGLVRIGCSFHHPGVVAGKVDTIFVFGFCLMAASLPMNTGGLFCLELFSWEIASFDILARFVRPVFGDQDAFLDPCCYIRLNGIV